MDTMPRLTWDLLTGSVTIDGIVYMVNNPRALRLFTIIAEHFLTTGLPVTRRQIAASARGFRGRRTVHRLLAQLPSAVRSIIQSGEPGYWIRLPVRENGACMVPTRDLPLAIAERISRI